MGAREIAAMVADLFWLGLDADAIAYMVAAAMAALPAYTPTVG